MAIDQNIEFKGYACFEKSGEFKPWSYKPRALGPKDVEIDIQFCGVCASDHHTINSGWGPTMFPCIVGHEIAGTVAQVGSEVKDFKKGQRVGVGAQVLSCQEADCPGCSAGHSPLCRTKKNVYTYNAKYEDGEQSQGGYAKSVRVDHRFVFAIPDALPLDAAAPLLCAGITTFAPLVDHGAKKGGLKVGVVGIGGLGHLAVQWAVAMKNDVYTISHSDKKKADAKKMGSQNYIVSANKDDMKKHQGQLDLVIVSSNHEDQPWNEYLGLLKPLGTCVLLAVPEKPISFMPSSLVMGQINFTGSLVGDPKQIRDMLKFAAEHDVKPWIEVMALKDVNKAYKKVFEDSDVRYRVVLDTNKM